MQWLEINRQFKCWTHHCSLSHLCVSSLSTQRESHIYVVQCLTIEQSGIRGGVDMKKGEKKVWTREEIRQYKNRGGQRACWKQRLITEMTLFWMACLMINLLLHERERERTECTVIKETIFATVFSFSYLEPLQRPAAHRRSSSTSTFTLPTCFLCLCDRFTVTRPFSSTVSTSPTCSRFGQKRWSKCSYCQTITAKPTYIIYLLLKPLMCAFTWE